MAESRKQTPVPDAWQQKALREREQLPSVWINSPEAALRFLCEWAQVDFNSCRKISVDPSSVIFEVYEVGDDGKFIIRDGMALTRSVQRHWR